MQQQEVLTDSSIVLLITLIGKNMEYINESASRNIWIITKIIVPKISEAARAAMEADLILKELSITIKSKAMKDTAPGPDGIPYSVYSKLWKQAGPLKGPHLTLGDPPFYS